MGTFYHRLPLLDPGLLRIGFGMERGTAVLDSGSMVAPVHSKTWAVWPPPDGAAIGRRLAPELPNPVPGADQSGWGYPITFQWFGPDAAPSITLQLFRDLQLLPCYFSSPGAPTNPDLAPRGAFCLIPKATLEPGVTYLVGASGLPGDGAGKPPGKVSWRFTTGK